MEKQKTYRKAHWFIALRLKVGGVGGLNPSTPTKTLNEVFFNMWTFYILYSSMKDTYYIGFTGDVITERIRKHNTNHKGFTGRIGDWRIKYTEVYPTKKEAT